MNSISLRWVCCSSQPILAHHYRAQALSNTYAVMEQSAMLTETVRYTDAQTVTQGGVHMTVVCNICSQLWHRHVTVAVCRCSPCAKLSCKICLCSSRLQLLQPTASQQALSLTCRTLKPCQQVQTSPKYREFPMGSVQGLLHHTVARVYGPSAVNSHKHRSVVDAVPMFTSSQTAENRC